MVGAILHCLSASGITIGAIGYGAIMYIILSIITYTNIYIFKYKW